MKLGVLVTNHGKHSDEKLAYAAAEEIVTFSDDAAEENVAAGRKLVDQIAAAVQDFFNKLSTFEHAEIDVKGTVHLASTMDAHPEFLAGAVSAVMGVIAASPFAGIATESAVRDVLVKWIKSAQHMHRDWFAKWGKVGSYRDLKASDKHNPECEHVKGWIAAAA